MRKIFIVTDYNCNSHCISCAKEIDEKGYLTLEQIIEQVDIIKPNREDYIEINGGEPTLRKDIIKICNYIKSNYETNLIILSNGRKFSDESFVKKIKDVGVDRVMTTFYSDKEKIHDNITKIKGSFLESVKGLKNLEKLGMPISVKTIILKQNYKRLSEFVDFAYDTFPSAWVSIHGLIIRGQAKTNKNYVVARYKDIKPFVENALDTAITKNKNLGVFMIPSCTIDPYYWKHLSINWKNLSQTMIYISPEKKVFGNLPASQPEYCKGCFVEDNCSWAWEAGWKEYIELFGTEELNKITTDMIRYKK